MRFCFTLFFHINASLRSSNNCARWMNNIIFLHSVIFHINTSLRSRNNCARRVNNIIFLHNIICHINASLHSLTKQHCILFHPIQYTLLLACYTFAWIFNLITPMYASYLDAINIRPISLQWPGEGFWRYRVRAQMRQKSTQHLPQLMAQRDTFRSHILRLSVDYAAVSWWWWLKPSTILCTAQCLSPFTFYINAYPKNRTVTKSVFFLKPTLNVFSKNKIK